MSRCVKHLAIQARYVSRWPFAVLQEENGDKRVCASNWLCIGEQVYSGGWHRQMSVTAGLLRSSTQLCNARQHWRWAHGGADTI